AWRGKWAAAVARITGLLPGVQRPSTSSIPCKRKNTSDWRTPPSRTSSKTSAEGVAMGEEHEPLPPVTAALRAEAAANPGGWVYSIDAYFSPDGAVPPHGIIGAWKVDGSGLLTGEFKRNPSYR